MLQKPSVKAKRACLCMAQPLWQIPWRVRWQRKVQNSLFAQDWQANIQRIETATSNRI